ncbi:MAG TPA: flagellar basal body-associated FliL family protein [Candidatus Acidoferrum sp.]|nr:flagellar basal body-associated FliL family protein [Candidatus Acidoferrum sp.]
MKKLLFILLPLLLLLGGGGGAWFFFLKAPAEGDKSAAAAPAANKHKAETKAVFVDVGEIIVPIYNRDGKNNLMVVRMELEVGDVMPVDEVRYMLPRLRDAYIGTLSTLAGRGELADESQRNATMKRALKLASDHVLGPDAIRDVLLQRAWQQPM